MAEWTTQIRTMRSEHEAPRTYGPAHLVWNGASTSHSRVNKGDPLPPPPPPSLQLLRFHESKSHRADCARREEQLLHLILSMHSDKKTTGSSRVWVYLSGRLLWCWVRDPVSVQVCGAQPGPVGRQQWNSLKTVSLSYVWNPPVNISMTITYQLIHLAPL